MTFTLATALGRPILPMREYESRQAAASAARKHRDVFGKVRVVTTEAARLAWRGIDE